MRWLASIGLSGSVLAVFAAITSVAIGWTYLATKDQIDMEVRRAEARQLLEIFPPRPMTTTSLTMVLNWLPTRLYWVFARLGRGIVSVAMTE